MTRSSQIWATEQDAARHTSHDEHLGYHPGCGQAHSHKSAKTLLGVGALVLLSVLLYEVNGDPARQPDSQAAPAPQTLAHNH